MKKIITILTTLVMIVGLTGCGGSDTSSSDDLSGTISLNGSTSMEEVVNALGEGFTNNNPNVKVEPQFTGSSAGIEAVTNKTADIGDASRALSDDEKSKGLVENIVAIDGIAVVTDKKNTTKGLTTQQLKDIYTGKINNWQDVGGPNESIVVIGRESGSGTRGAFEEILGITDQCKLAQEIDSTGAVVAKVAQTPGAIGYVSLDVVDKTVSALKLDNVKPSVKTVGSGDYTLQRPFVMATRGKISKQSKAVQKFFEYIKSEEGQKIITNLGLVVPKK
ncbi:MAG: phosphate ABC transporter substrate-binding protein [Thomasclavelia sp.]|jgi:phosphate transport system substrate-binding protein|nr:phosphate ABC transporter substrate-binding protein [Thomasclavelia sp.]